MKYLHRLALCSIAVCCMLLLMGCGSGEREFVLASIPEKPDMAGWPDRLHQRIENAELEALNGKDPVQSLAELSKIYHANGFYEEASVCYQGLIALETDNAKWPHLLAEILSSYGQLDDALPLRVQAAKLAPDYVPALIRLGDVYLKRNRLDDAVEYYQAALKQDDNNPYALVGLARVDVIGNRLNEARQKLEVATRESENRIGADLLATVYAELGLFERAATIRGRSKSSGSFSDIPDPWLFELYSESFDPYQIAVAAGMADHGGNPKAGIRLLNRAIQLAPQDASLHYQLALIYLRMGNPSKSLKSLDDCVKADPTFSDGWFRMASIHSEMGNSDEAARALAAGLYHNPDSPGLHVQNGRRLKALGDISGAIKEVEKAIELRPEEADPYVDLASLYLSQNQVDKGVSLLEKALELESLHPLALSTMAFYNISQGNEERARYYLRKLELQPRLPIKDRQNLETQFKKRFGSVP